MEVYIVNGLILILFLVGSEGVYYNGTNDVAGCQVTNLYGCVMDTECCFYFAETSSCSGNCKSEMELDPQTFAPKQVNQSCCAPVAKRYRQTVLWCKGEADIPTKKVDLRFPGWYYEEGFQYAVATQCDCVGSDWQSDVRTRGRRRPEETEQPEEQLLRVCMETTQLPTAALIPTTLTTLSNPTVPTVPTEPEACFEAYPNITFPPAYALNGTAVRTVEECARACLNYELEECAGFVYNLGARRCTRFLASNLRVNTGSQLTGITHYRRICPSELAIPFIPPDWYTTPAPTVPDGPGS